MKARHAITLGLLLVSATVFAQSLDDLVASATKMDETLRQLELSRERLDVQYALEDLRPAFMLSLGTGNSGLSIQTNGGAEGPVSGGSPDLSYSVGPRAVMTLNGDHSITAEASLSGSSEHSAELRSAGAAYTWNIGVPGTSLEDRVSALVQENARLDADQQIADRARQIRQLVLQQSRAVLAAEAALVEAVIAVDSARTAQAEARALGSTGPESAVALELTITLDRARRIAERRELEVTEAIGNLAEFTGIVVEQAPRFPSVPTPEPVPDAISGPRYEGSIRDYRISELRFGAGKPDEASFSASASYRYTPSQEQALGPDLPALHTLGAGGAVEFGDWSFELGTSFRLSEDSDIAPVATTTTVGVTWALPNTLRDSLESRLDEIDLERAVLTLESSKGSIQEDLQDLAVERRALVEREVQLEEDLTLAELRFAEAQRRRELGLAGNDLVAEREAALERLTFDRQLLAYDVELFALAVAAITGESE
jgi:hypothetical protein